jgi:hypothetical protein
MPVNLEVLRPDDLLAIGVQTVNLKLDSSQPGQPRLVREKPGEPAYLIFTFPSQSIAEQAFFETASVQQPGFNPPQVTPPLSPPPTLPPCPDSLPLPGAAAAVMAGTSRLAFQLPASLEAIDYTIAGLLDWSPLEPVLPAAARVLPGATSAPGEQPPAIAAPAELETALELPYRLIGSPNVTPGGGIPAWTHASGLVVRAGRAELWHTRLGRQHRAGGQATITEASQTSPVPIRAVWSPDFVADGPLPSPPPPPTGSASLRVAMSDSDRDQIVILSAGFSGYTWTDPHDVAHPYVPAPADASQLFLSSLGGWLTARGAWPYPVSYTYAPRFRPSAPLPGGPARPAEEAGGPGEQTAVTRVGLPPRQTAELDLIEWDHVATQGRDHYVRIVYEGFLYPFGHRASLVKVTERKVLAPQGQAGNQADSPVAFLMQRMYIVVRDKELSYQGEPYAHHGLEMPFAAMVRINTRVTPEIDPPPSGANTFWVNVGQQPFQFHVTARDPSGADVNFLAPLIFISLSESNLDIAAGDYVADNTQRRCAVRAHNVTYADPSAGDTALKTGALYFTAQPTGQPQPWVTAPFLPTLDNAEVTIPALSDLIGKQVAVLIELYGPYLQAGLDPNAGVYADIVGQPYPVAFSADQAGGFARPNLGLSAVSARKGLVAGSPADAANGEIDPGKFFGQPDAELFGTIPLGNLIPVDPHTMLASAAQNAPEIRTTAKPNRTNPTQLVTNISWQPQLQNFDGRLMTPKLPVQAIFNAGGQVSELNIKVTIETNLNGQPATSTATSKLSNFTLQLFDIVYLTVASITFESKNAAKSTVALDLAATNPIAFKGPLEFVQNLASILPSGLFGGSGPSIKLTKTELKVSYTLGLPPIACGVFSLQNIAIMAGLDLPYLDGKPAVEFGFATRSRPFLLTVEIFGGGGFVHLIVGADGVQMVEGALEFGGNYALDLGVASGAVHAMAGIYFQLKGSSSDLTGFIDVGGEVSVLGIISISIDLNLSLSWESSPAGNVIEGRATLTVSVSVLFFSATVQLSVERSFQAGGHDPDVGQLMTAPEWAKYAQAFT